MRITAYPHSNYFEIDGRIIHESSLPVLKARGLLENADEVEAFKGDYIREQAYALEGAEAVALFSQNAFYRIDTDGGIIAGKAFEFKEFEVPDGVKIIRKSAFRGIACITAVVLPNSVEVIEEDAFNGCINLEKVTFNYGLTTIQSRAFSDTAISTPIDIPASINIISPKGVFPASAKVAFVDRSIPTGCKTALIRCGLRLKYK